MKKIIFLIAFLSFELCFCQFGIINDHDGYVNVRVSPNKSSKIIDKLENGYVVSSLEGESNNWIPIEYQKDKKNLTGYVYKSKITDLSHFKHIPIKLKNKNFVELSNDNIKIEVTQTDFIKKNHKLSFYKNNLSQLTKIDDIEIFGTDGNIPKREYKSISIQKNGMKIELPKSALKNLFEPNLENTTANYDSINDVLYLESVNSDGAGGYMVLWIIEKNKYKKRIELYGF